MMSPAYRTTHNKNKGFNEMGIIPKAISPLPNAPIWYLPGGMIWWATAPVPAVPVVLPGGMIWWAAPVPAVPVVSVVPAVPAVTATLFGIQICAAATTVSGAMYAAVTKSASVVFSVAASFIEIYDH